MLGELIAQQTVNNRPVFVVTGGGGGLMADIARGAYGHSIGVEMTGFANQVPVDNPYREIRWTNSWAERANAYEASAMRTVALPGGLGTETEILQKAIALWTDSTTLPAYKRIVLLDRNGFFTAPGGLMSHMAYVVRQRGWPPAFLDMFKIAKTPEEAAAYLFEPGVPTTPGQRLNLTA